MSERNPRNLGEIINEFVYSLPPIDERSRNAKKHFLRHPNGFTSNFVSKKELFLRRVSLVRIGTMVK